MDLANTFVVDYCIILFYPDIKALYQFLLGIDFILWDDYDGNFLF